MARRVETRRGSTGARSPLRWPTSLFAAAVILVAVLAAGVSGAPNATAQEGVEMTVEVGVDGYVSPDEPNSVRVTLAADVLFVGELRIETSESVVVSAVEVPAGTTKVYTLEVLVRPSATSVVVTLNRDGTKVTSESVRVDRPWEANLVGIYGNQGVAAAIENSSTVGFDVDLETVIVSDDVLRGPFDVVDHLVITETPDGSVHAAVVGWVEDGGHVYAPAGVLADLGLRAGPLSRGHILEVDSVDGPFQILPAEVTSGFQDHGFDDIGSTLFEAASIGGSGDLGFDWLAWSLVAYVALLGPLNFFVLGRMGRRELAWVTVPVLSLLGVVAFVTAGERTGEAANIRQATIHIQAPDGVVAESGFVLVAPAEGEHRLALENGGALTPFDAGRWFGGGSAKVEVVSDGSGGSEVRFDLSTLGVGAASASWQPDPVAVEVIAGSVRNDSDVHFSVWGVHTEDGTFVSGDALPAGQSREIGEALHHFRDPWSNAIADTVFQVIQFRDFESQQPIYPLSWAASRISPDLVNQGFYFFGFTDELKVPVLVDGDPRAAGGQSLVVSALADAPGRVASPRPILIAAPGAEYIERIGPTFVYGASELQIRFDVAQADTSGPFTLRVDPQNFGIPANFDLAHVYNWETGDFFAVGADVEFSGQSFVSESGVMLVRVDVEFDHEFFVDALELEVGG